MVRHEQIESQSEFQQAAFSEEEIHEAAKIEELLRNAHQIHRAHRGLFGYDLEDWLEAERRMAAKSDKAFRELEHIAQSGAKAAEQRKAFSSCAGHNH